MTASRSVSIRRFARNEWPMYRDLRLRALTDSPDAFGSTYAREAAFPDEKWASRLEQGVASARDLPLVAEVGGEAVGLAWGRFDEREPDVANVYQVWVAPPARGLGAGAALIDAIVCWARAANARSVALRVTSGNSAAVRLYLRAGFTPTGESEPLREGSAVMTQTMRLVL